MTVKISVSLPDDVAKRLAQEENVSAWLTEAARRQIAREATRSALRAAGMGDLSQERIDAAGERMQGALDSITPAMRERAVELLAARTGSSVEEVRRVLDRDRH